MEFSDARKNRATLRRYERALKNEKSRFGIYSDGYGKRHFLGPLYLLLDDLPGALASFDWFEREFPDDCGEPGQYLCWTLALQRSDHVIESAAKLRQTSLLNLYVVPHLLGESIDELDIWLGSSDEWPEYVHQIPREYFELWSESEKEWARQVCATEDFKRVVGRWIEIHAELKDLPRGPRRSALVDEAFSLRV